MPVRKYTNVKDMTGSGYEFLTNPDGSSAMYYNGRLISVRSAFLS